MKNGPPPNSLTLHSFNNHIKQQIRWNEGHSQLTEDLLLKEIGRIHTGLSDKDEIGIVHRPWTDFFASWTSNRRASP